MVLPSAEVPIGRRMNVSPACWQRWTDLLGFEAEHLPALRRHHQLAVDTYGAQHGGGRTPAISVPFSLLGLQLALEAGWSGTAVRAAHQYLAQRDEGWPRFVPPDAPHWLTVAAVATSVTVAEHPQRIQAWAASVWGAWRGDHERVRSWAAAVLPADVRGRLQAS